MRRTRKERLFRSEFEETREEWQTEGEHRLYGEKARVR